MEISDYADTDAVNLEYQNKTFHYRERKEYIEMFDPEEFKDNVGLVVSKLSKYLSDKSIRGINLYEPETLMKKIEAMTILENPEGTKEKLSEIVDLYIKTAIQVHSPGYMGRQFSGVYPLAGVMDFVSSVLSQPASFYEAGQLPIAIEKVMAHEFNKFIGYTGDFEFVTTTGGSLANMTALLAARNHRYPNVWDKGLDGLEGLKPAIAVSESIHYSISRAAGIIGIGENQIVKIPLNERKQICIGKVESTIIEARQRGLDVFCLVGAAGSTSVGAFDNIEELAEIAEKLDLWLHIDAAHGGSVLVSDDHRHKVKGIEKADSFVWDAHKMMFVPAMCTFLFYKKKEYAKGAFRQEASYVFDPNDNIYAMHDSASKNFECTKRPMILHFWTLWAIYGKSIFSDKLEYLFQMTQSAFWVLKDSMDFEAIHEPEANIICFRYKPQNYREDMHDFQLQIRNGIREGGKFFISKVDIDGATALRVVFMNHDINISHFNALLNEIRILGQKILNTKN
ncbi:pyridoxal phosphate-dependent decarboxylase family protein [Aureibacter tunicatorum]|uniref:L-2,4-diaminobutyrate decarboxylase n=1 Tax=Aureibacter tunicatorum TaxID=866807 RepID=A0AAE4BRS4_9BACT|nr:pyridoxal-dependent decarboxylase [Aureibacter tunicatorum]MDR6238198.1 L-2,4-diaminobutyrate decarboxylase [Aureibacter tunicatorum]BDD03231.1 decarboxylase [Aureibacter tunicatorum]